MKVFCVILLSCVLAVSNARKTSIKFISGPEVVADLGRSASLVCKVENGKEYPILWMKKSSSQDTEYLPLSTGKNLIINNNPRFNLSYESVNNEIVVTLQINNIEEIDSAMYLCQVVVGINNKITERVELKVKTPVRLEDASTKELTVIEGQEASLDCVASGFPQPRIDWTRHDGKILFHGKQSFSGSSLKIPSVARSDRGQYLCVASNNVGPEVNMTASLIVRYGPQISVPRPRLQQALGYDVMLQCTVDSYPTSAIDWYKDGRVVENKRRFTVAHFNTGTTSTLTTLKIYGLDASDYGSYECHANNAHGNHSQAVELIKTKIPIPEAAFGGSFRHSCVSTLLACIITFCISFLVF